MKSILGVILCVLVSIPVLAQIQACPANDNFSMGTITHWSAYTGNNRVRGSNTTGEGDLGSLETLYDTTGNLGTNPLGTNGVGAINEYGLGSPDGIQVLTSSTIDPFGFFQTIPNINGYQYAAAVKLGSTTISEGPQGSDGGYVRGISYTISVPTNPANPSQPYTMTYAYAMVLENGTHPSDEQPLFSATLVAGGKIITCASPEYYLPTFNNANSQDQNATLDTAAAEANGFQISRTVSPNPNPNSPNGGHLLDVWWKGWTEVTFDLSPYRGQTVVLTFEADNCVPGGHFAYAYVALRNICAGLMITGPNPACENTDLTYSIPSLNGATYNWSIPPGWTLNSSDTSYIIQANAGATGGEIIAHEVNSCANLHDTIQVTTVPGTVPGQVSGGTEICAGTPNSSLLTLAGNQGGVLYWIATSKGVTTNLANGTVLDTAANLTDSTTFAAVVQNGESCAIDTSGSVTIPVDPMTEPGTISPSNISVCLNQNKDAVLTITGAVGKPTNWQDSSGATAGVWANTTPTDTTLTYGIDDITANTNYRAIVKSGVCPADTTNVAQTEVLPYQFPQASIDPADTTICYGSSITLNANISEGTSYTWANADSLNGSLQNSSPGSISTTPSTLTDVASPKTNTGYILSIINGACPNPLLDTFQVNVDPPITVFAGDDTDVVVGQPLQLDARSSDPAGSDTFTWSPGAFLNNPNIYNPVAVFTEGLDSIVYTATATNAIGCTGSANVRIEVFTTQPDIFVPSAFTPTVNIDNIFRPIYVGITSVEFFRVYNRYGQLVYATSDMESGWDGTVGGKIQEPSAFVWMVEGTSYTGKKIFKKGTVVLIR